MTPNQMLTPTADLHRGRWDLADAGGFEGGDL